MSKKLSLLRHKALLAKSSESAYARVDHEAAATIGDLAELEHRLTAYYEQQLVAPARA